MRDFETYHTRPTFFGLTAEVELCHDHDPFREYVGDIGELTVTNHRDAGDAIGDDLDSVDIARARPFIDRVAALPGIEDWIAKQPWAKTVVGSTTAATLFAAYWDGEWTCGDLFDELRSEAADALLIDVLRGRFEAEVLE